MQNPSATGAPAQPASAPANRAYCLTDWHRDFAKAFAAAVPLEAMPTQARGALLAADNDEPEPSTLVQIIEEAQADARAICRGTVSYPSPAEQIKAECDEGQAVEHRLGLTGMGGATHG